MLPPLFQQQIGYASHSFETAGEELLGLFYEKELAEKYLEAVIAAAAVIARYYGYEDISQCYEIREYLVALAVENPKWDNPPRPIWVVSCYAE